MWDLRIQHDRPNDVDLCGSHAKEFSEKPAPRDLELRIERVKCEFRTRAAGLVFTLQVQKLRGGTHDTVR
jgi:hypothetical protein